ncbi:MAG: hypothetical protein V4677_18275 [Bacteroidota bacterium]
MLELNWTGYLNHFKKLIGQTNHYLITILIGIEGVRKGEVTKGDTFNVTWNPISLEDTSRRSRAFARNAALSWAIDSLDAYLGYLKKHPFKFPEVFITKIQNDRSIYNNLNEVIAFTKYPIDLPLSLVHMGIQWRNNLVHYHANNNLDFDFASFIRNIEKVSIQERFRGLDPQLMLENFDERKSPTFKEVAAIIQSIHFLVLELDKVLKDYIDIDIFIDHLIRENELEIVNIITSNPDKRLKKMKQFLFTKGFKETVNLETKNLIDDKKIEEIIKACIQQRIDKNEALEKK